MGMIGLRGSAGLKGRPGKKRDGLGSCRKSVGRHCRSRRAGGGDRVWTDRADGQTGKRGSKDRSPEGACRARRQGAGGAGRAAVSLTAGGRMGPLAEHPDRSYLVSNGDVDASEFRRWDDH